jgi:hypothetical protein
MQRQQISVASLFKRDDRRRSGVGREQFAYRHMIAVSRTKTEAATIREPPTSRNISGEAPMTAERQHSRALVRHSDVLPGRKLRNRIIIANAVAWVAIALLIRVILF